MKKRIYKNILILLFSLNLFLNCESDMETEYKVNTGSAIDTIAPTIANVSIEGTPTGPSGGYQSGNKITVSAEITDSSGIFFVSFSVRDELGKTYGLCVLPDVSGNTWSCDMTLKYLDFNGTEYISVHVEDTASNSEFYLFDPLVSTINYTRSSDDSDSATPIKFVTLEAGGIYDIDPPILESLTVTGSPTGPGGGYLTGDVITVSGDITDATEISFVYFLVYDYTWNNYGACSASFVSGSNWSCDITLSFSEIPTGNEYLFVDVKDVFFQAEKYYYSPLDSNFNYTKMSDGTVSGIPIEFLTLE